MPNQGSNAISISSINQNYHHHVSPKAYMRLLVKQKWSARRVLISFSYLFSWKFSIIVVSQKGIKWDYYFHFILKNSLINTLTLSSVVAGCIPPLFSAKSKIKRTLSSHTTLTLVTPLSAYQPSLLRSNSMSTQNPVSYTTISCFFYQFISFT